MNRLAVEFNRLELPKKLGLIVLLFVCTYALLTGAIYQATRRNTLGTDFFIYFAAGRNIIINGESPYIENVGKESQLAIIKRYSQNNEDQLRFVYPPYALIPILPLVSLPFPLAQAAWMAYGLLILFLAFAFAFPAAPRWLLASLLVLYPISFGFLLGNFDILIISVLFLLAGKMPRLLPKNKAGQVFLGICLAWITIKPQFTWFYILFFLMVAFQKNLKSFLFGFTGGLAAFLAFSFFIVPNWIFEWITLLRRYPSYTGGKISITPLLDLFLPSQYFTFTYVGCFLMLAGILIFLSNKWRKREFSTLGLLAYGGFFTYFFHPTGISYEQMTFLIPVILWIVILARRHQGKAALAWVSLLLLSWLIFVISRFGILRAASTNGLYILYIVWLTFGLLLPPRFLKELEIG